MYLITKEQFGVIAKHYNNQEVEIKFEEVNEFYTISEEIYGKVIKLGEHDGINIFSLTCPDVTVMPIKETDKIASLKDYLRNLYTGLKEAFPVYSEHMILYYLYKRSGINSVFSVKELQEAINQVKEDIVKEEIIKEIVKEEIVKEEVKEEIKEEIVKEEVKEEIVKEEIVETAPEEFKGGIDLLSFPNVNDEDFTAELSENEKKSIENAKEIISKSDNPLMEVEDIVCTRNLVGIEHTK